jgi:PTH1 family peptidyl-tRNA hydrolase
VADTPALKLVVGLGNPGSRYKGTRHNVGFAVVNLLTESSGVGRPQERFQAEIREWRLGDDKVLLVKPQTFMNLSGRPVRQLMDFYQLPVTNLLIVCDDFNLPLGKLRFRARGTHGGHNGLRDIQSHLSSTTYSRLRIGVGAPPDAEAVDYVLGRFRPSERPVIEDTLRLAAQGVETWLRSGIEASMNQYNG